MKTIILAAFFCLYSFSLLAQTGGYSIKGIVADTASKSKLVNSTVTVLNSKDSILYKFTRTGAGGSFGINNMSPGKFLLLVTYHGYADYIQQFSLDPANRAQDFGQINLTLKSRLLEEVVINGTAAITIKGDTTVFNTSNLKIQPNANVEDLLRQLPGIQIDQNGKITAQGQAVNKVLVDGEEFFGDDPTLVTRNLRADMVKSAQLYDKKSDQATFTGIDDGQRTKTLNIQLKDGSKNGYFGKADVGETPDNYYQGQAMFNKFKTKEKLSAYGTIGNTGRTGLGFEDVGKYGSSNIQILDANGGSIIIGSLGGGDELESFNGRYDGRGFPLAHTGGVHYDTKWNNDKQSLNTNYKIGDLSVDGSQNTIKQTNLPNGILHNTTGQNYNNYAFRQKIDATYEIKMSPTSTLKIGADGTLRNTENINSNVALSSRADNTKLNSSDRNLSNNVDQQMMNASIFWTKRLKKPGRTFSLNITEALNASDSKGFLNSTNKFYNASEALDSTKVIDQYKTSKNTSSVLGSNMTWSEPFSKTFSLVLNYGLILRNETAERSSFNKSSPASKYDILDQQYSNNFGLKQTTNQAGAIFNYSKGKTVLNFGTRLSGVSFNQTDLDNHIEYKRNYLNWSPQARYQYRFSQQGAFMINYSGTTTQPAINQIQPIKVNDDPLNITIGNPDLKPSFRNNLFATYSSFKVLTGQSFSLFASYSLTSNQISNVQFIDDAGKSTFQAINLTGKTPVNYSMSASLGRKIKGTILNARLSLGLNAYTNYNFISSQTVQNALNKSEGYNYSAGIGLNATKVKKYSFFISLDPRYTDSRSSLLPASNDNIWALSSRSSFTIFLPGKVELSSDMFYNYTQNSAAFTQSFNPFILNSTISKKFFKKENLKFSITGSDLLKQNMGVVRTAFNQNTYTTIQRYFMGSLTWDFTKPVPTAVKKQ